MEKTSILMKAFVKCSDLWLVMPLMRKGSCLRIMRHLKSCGLGEGLKEEWIATSKYYGDVIRSIVQ